MKSMRLPLAAKLFMTYFHRAGGGVHGPLGLLPVSTTDVIHEMYTQQHKSLDIQIRVAKYV